MTQTLISLMSILAGIIAANIMGLAIKKYSFGLTGNTIIGVFGSAFFVKSFGRLGFAPSFIVTPDGVNIYLLSLNIFISVGGAILGIFFRQFFKRKMQKKN